MPVLARCAAVLGVAALLGASGLASTAHAAAPESDYAYAQFGVGAEYLLADFYGRAVASKQFSGVELAALRRARFNAGEQLAALSRILSDGAQPVAAAADFTFTYPLGAFGTRTSIAKTGSAIEQAVLGAYLSAAVSVSVPSFREVFARVIASTAEHVSVLSRIAFGRPIGNSFPELVSLEAASDVLDPYFGG
jgi:hypothetical protein